MEKFLEFLYTGYYMLAAEAPGHINKDLAGLDGANPGRHSEASSPNDTEGEQSYSNSLVPISRTEKSSLKPSFQNTSASSRSEGEDKGSAGKPLTTCITENPAYFHARMFAEGDYFLVDKLKARAQGRFIVAFSRILQKENLRKEALEQTVEEVYSDRASYEQLRKFTILLIVTMLGAEHRPFLRDCMRSSPNFTFDLCMALLD